MRLDVFISLNNTGFSRSIIQKFIKKNGIKVNGKLIKKPHSPIGEEDKVVFDNKAFESFVDIFTKSKAIIQEKLDEKAIIYNGKHFFVIEKPPFVRTESLTVGFFSVHRLDKNTSGVLVIARDAETQKTLQRQWQDKKVKKTYLALVKGHLSPIRGAIEGGIARSGKDRTKMVISSVLNAKKAYTEYEVMEYFDKTSLNSKLTLLKVFPSTGRTHQIRVHLAGIGHPVCGDEKYGDATLNKAFLELGLKRQFLHAFELQFNDPETKKRTSFKSVLYNDLKLVLDALNP